MIKFLSHSFVPAVKFVLANHFFIKYMPYTIRHWYLRNIIGIKIGKESAICGGCYITGNNIRIGNNSVLNRFVYVDGRGPLYIGNNVNVSHYVIIHTLTHDTNSPVFQAVQKPVAIMDNAWIGARAIILPGVTVGKGAVVAAGSVVVKDVAEYEIVSGVPAKKIGERSKELIYKTRYFPLFDTDIQ